MGALIGPLLSIGSDLLGSHLFGAHKAAGGGLNAALAPLAAGVSGRFLVGFLAAFYLTEPEFRDCINGFVWHAIKSLF